MVMKYFLPLILSQLVICTSISGQIGGQRLFEWGTKSGDPSILAQGGMMGAYPSDRVNQNILLPSRSNPTQNGEIGMGFQFLKGGARHGVVSMALDRPNWGVLVTPFVDWVQYGKFKLTDEGGNVLGEFSAIDLKMGLSAQRQINQRLSVGASLQYLLTSIETYKAHGISANLSGMYFIPEKELGISLDAINIGAAVSRFNGKKDKLITPFDIRIGFSQKLKHMPLRFSIIAHHLYQWDINYDNPIAAATNTILGEDQPTAKSATSVFVNNFFRHLNFGGELLFGAQRSFSLRFGYNHMQRTDLKVVNYKSLTGMSIGFGLRKKYFAFDYALQFYHIGNNFQTLGLQIPILGFKKKSI